MSDGPLRKSSRKGRPVARLGDSPEPSPPSSPSPAVQHNLIVDLNASSRVPGEPQPPPPGDTVPESVPTNTRPWQGYTRLTLYEYWCSAKQVVNDLKLVNASLRRSISAKDRELGSYVRRLANTQTGMGELNISQVTVERLKSEKKALAEQLSSAKSSGKDFAKKSKEALADQKDRHKLALATVNVNHQAELGKLKLEVTRLGIVISARDSSIKQQDVNLAELVLKSKKYDEFQAMGTKANLQNRAYLDRIEMR